MMARVQTELAYRQNARPFALNLPSERRFAICGLMPRVIPHPGAFGCDVGHLTLPHESSTRKVA